ncbi:hypothetical protein V2J09_002332 [Rumex salicifolius]
MSKGGHIKLLTWAILLSLAGICKAYSQCNCDDEGFFWTANRILECQRVSDFFIAIAYFSIPIELLYFVSRSHFPFKWVFIQFIAFIVLCGLTHLLNSWTYYGPLSFQLMICITILKLLTALVSCATTVTLLTLFPLLLKLKVRELFLRQNVLDLDQEVGMMKKKKEASLHVRMLTQEIRKSLDRHTILYSTLVQLSKTLHLQNCAVWMPNDNATEMSLTHELNPVPSLCRVSIHDPDVVEIKGSKGVKTLRPDSPLGEPGHVATAIRMPMLRVSNFKGGTPEVIQASYAILVLIYPSSKPSIWNHHELEIVEAVADQVAVALSHADILEESQRMREKLAEQNRALQLARKSALMASQARNAFQKVMSNGMRRPMHSILGLLSMFHDNVNPNLEQRVVVEAMVRTSHVLSTLINDAMELPTSTKEDGSSCLPLEMRPFSLICLLREAACLINSMFVLEGIGFLVDVQKGLPDEVIGDKRRTFQVILHMVGYLLDVLNEGASVVFLVSSSRGGASEFPDYINVKLEFKMDGMMQGDIWISSDPFGEPKSMNLVLGFKIQALSELGDKMDVSPSLELQGLKIMLVEDDNVNRIVTTRLLEKLGCHVSAVSSGFECLTNLGPAGGSAGVPFEVILLDLHMPEMDGFEVAMRVRKFHSPTWPPIIALTASAEDNVWERCHQMGMNGLIRKPIVLQGIAQELTRVLRRPYN